MALSRQKALTKVFGDPQAKILKKLEKRVGAINALADTYKKMSDADLKKQTDGIC
jgi:preprotein translocase subunit SecA